MEKKFIRVDKVAKELEISESHAYKIMRKLNRELEAKGFITVAGRVLCCLRSAGCCPVSLDRDIGKTPNPLQGCCSVCRFSFL